MNAVWNSAINFNQENANGSDSETNSDDLPDHYQPISGAFDDDEELSDQNSDDSSDLNAPHPLPNGYASRSVVESGVSSLDLNDDEEEREREEEEEERVLESSNSAIRRAFREDERRRNAPLTIENATRVVEAMRGVSFSGLAPAWANRVPEDRWIDQVRRLRRTSNSTATTQD